MHFQLKKHMFKIENLDFYTKDNIVKELIKLKPTSFKTVATVNGEMLIKGKSDPHIQHYLETADWCLADGKSIQWWISFKARQKCALNTGVDLVLSLLKQPHKTFYLVGSSDPILQRALLTIKNDFPTAHIGGAHNGYINSEEEKKIIEDIILKKPDFVLVGMGSPKQERFLLTLKQILVSGIGIGVGRTFDMLGGKFNRAPKLVRRAGFEWLWRGFQDPKRVTRWGFIPKFILHIIKN